MCVCVCVRVRAVMGWPAELCLSELCISLFAVGGRWALAIPRQQLQPFPGELVYVFTSNLNESAFVDW